MPTLIVCLLLIAVPLACGAGIGTGVRRGLGRRVGGLVLALLCLGLTSAACVALVARFPVIGLWDAACQGLLLGLGILIGSHRAFADARNLGLLAAAVSLSLLLLEGLSRMFLPPPPGFPDRGGPHLFLSDILRSDLSHQPWDTLCKEVVCSIVFGDEYESFLDLADAEREIVTPRVYRPRQEATRRVLHLGDSMAFGFGLPREQTFTAQLESLDPHTEHVNAAIPGTAPDAYLRVMMSWIARQRFDLVVLHVYEGNDLDGLDGNYSCCDWRSLLTYDGPRALPRCTEAAPANLAKAGLTWLRFHNPPPYWIRALVGSSSAAAYVAGILTLEPFFLVEQPMETRLEHLEKVLRAARDELAPRRIAFVVHVIPARTWLETGDTWQHYAPRIVEVGERAGVTVLDSSADCRAVVAAGGKLFFEHPADIHFSAAGHTWMAEWLRGRLASSSDG